MVGMRNDDGEDVASAGVRRGVAAARIVTKSFKTGAREITFIPCNENDGVTAVVLSILERGGDAWAATPGDLEVC